MWSYSEFSYLSESAESLKLSKEIKYKPFKKVFDVKNRKGEEEIVWKSSSAAVSNLGKPALASELQMLCGGSDGASLSCPSPHLNVFILVPTFISCWFHPSTGWVSHCILYFTTGIWSSPGSVAGKVWTGMTGWMQGWGNRGKKRGAHYILGNIPAPLQDGKSEPVPSDYLPDTSSTLDNFLELFLWLYFEGRNSEL